MDEIEKYFSSRFRFLAFSVMKDSLSSVVQRLVGIGLGATTLTSVVTAGSNNISNLPESLYNVSDFMTEPVTPQSTLTKNQDDMKVKMELFIMKIQVNKQSFDIIYLSSLHGGDRLIFVERLKMKKIQTPNF